MHKHIIPRKELPPAELVTRIHGCWLGRAIGELLARHTKENRHSKIPKPTMTRRVPRSSHGRPSRRRRKRWDRGDVVVVHGGVYGGEGLIKNNGTVQAPIHPGRRNQSGARFKIHQNPPCIRGRGLFYKRTKRKIRIPLRRNTLPSIR